MKIFRTPFFLPWIYPTLTWQVPATRPTLYLTFDDGPINGVTEFVLETLRRFQVKATFFCIGDNIRKHPSVFKKVLAEGHAVGNHTFHHVNGWKTSLEEYVAEVEACADIMRAQGIVQTSPMLFRPPYGKITKAQISAIKAYNIVMWDVLSYDFDKTLPKERCLAHTIRACRSGSVIVFHDSFKAENNLVYVLPRLIDHFLMTGFSFDTIHA